MIGFLYCKCTLLAQVQFFFCHYPQVLLCRATLNPVIPQPVSLPLLPQVEDLALGLVQFCDVHT